MPELANNFRLGKMEKDLDDRLVPNGSYRDALNVEIATSEGSDVGALQKTLGNTLISTISPHSSSKCIGYIRDTKNNKIYWFVCSDTKDLIVEYSESSGDILPVIVDTGKNSTYPDPILNFSQDYLITGVNIIDEVLYFTDNYNEPRQVDIAYWKSQTSTFINTSAGLQADKITVIRKSPLNASTFYALTSTTITGDGTESGDQVYVKINNSLVITLSSVEIGETINNITFVKVSDISIAADVSYVENTKLTLTNELGQTALIQITNNTGSPFTAILLSKDNNLSDSEDLSANGYKNAQQLIYNDASGHATNNINSTNQLGNTGCLLEWDATVNSAKDYDINIPNAGTYDITINIKFKIINPIYDVIFYYYINGVSSGQSDWISGANNVDSNGTATDITISQSYNGQIFSGTGNIIQIELRASPLNTPPAYNQPLINIYGGANGGTNFTAGSSILYNKYRSISQPNDGLFQDKFPRFAYRYKYDNGQYSCFSPFSIPAFIPSGYQYETKNAYNLGMVNTVDGITLTGWNADILNNNVDFVEQVDILYKNSSDQNVYILDTLKNGTGIFNNTGFPNTVDVKDEQIYKVVDSIQMLRPFDSVPKKAKAQELIGNRLVFSNYTHNFTYTGTPVFDISINTSRTDDFNQKLSVKSNRIYQFGIVFQDAYGRQTPVFTDKSGVINVGKSYSNTRNQFKVRASTTGLPDDITHFKYFIKEVSNEYYNISVANYYDDNEGFLYLSAPSADINKVSEGDYLILKKKNGTNSAYINDINKFKIINISPNPPEFLSKSYTILHTALTVDFAQTFTNSPLVQSTKKSGVTPVAGFNKILLKNLAPDGIPNGISTVSAGFLTIGAKVRFSGIGSRKTSNVYEISSVILNTVSGANSMAEVTFTKKFGNDIDAIYNSVSNFSSYLGLTIQFLSETNDYGNPAYTGKFFIKINNSTALSLGLNEYVDKDDLSVVASAYLSTSDNDMIKDFFGSILNDVLTIKTEANYGSIYILDSFANNIKVGNYIRISDTNFLNNGSYANVYKINDVSISGSTFRQWDITLDIAPPYNNGIIGTSDVRVDILNVDVINSGDLSDPAIFEVEPENGLLDIYYETQETYTVDKLLQTPITAYVNGTTSNNQVVVIDGNTGTLQVGYKVTGTGIVGDVYISSIFTQNSILLTSHQTLSDNTELTFTEQVSLSYANCISFENGVESDRIRDDYNAPTMGKGVRVSAVIEDNYQEDTLTNSFIYSQIYNSKSGVNRLNQFIIADSITKDINPSYGSIQKTFARDSDLVVLCEDKCLNVYANKDALYNADGSANLVASNRVLGDVRPFVGEYGISTNPESFVQFGFRSYFTDKARGVVLRLSADGLTPISEYGMSDYFSDKLSAESGYLFGSYDDRKNTYNLSFSDVNVATICFSEKVLGWTSRKSFIPEGGVSLNNKYFTFKNGNIYKHYDGASINIFYGAPDPVDSTVDFIINDAPSSVKRFKTINYEGDADWYVNSIYTNEHSGSSSTFVEKEGKFHSYIKGITSNSVSLNKEEFSVQGIGTVTSVSGSILTFAKNINSSLQKGDNIYFLDDNAIVAYTFAGTCSSKTTNTITLSGGTVPVAGKFILFDKGGLYNQSGILGFFTNIQFKHTGASAAEIYSVGSLVV